MSYSFTDADREFKELVGTGLRLGLDVHNLYDLQWETDNLLSIPYIRRMVAKKQMTELDLWDIARAKHHRDFSRMKTEWIRNKVKESR